MARRKKEVCMHISHSRKRKGLRVPGVHSWLCGGIENALSLLSIFIFSSIDKCCKDKHAWRLKEVEGGRVRRPGFSQRAHSVHCMLIKHSSAGWRSHVWQLQGEFLIYTLPHPGGCLVLVMAAVFTRCNGTKMFLTIQSWLFSVLHVTAAPKYIWLWLSPDISRHDLILTS